MREKPETHDTIAVRIAAPLKASERADATFADRVMQDVRAAARAASTVDSSSPSASWWRRPVTLRVSPIGALALAAGLAAVMLAGARVMSEQDRVDGESASVAARRDTVHLVRFVFVAPGASSVAVAGDFNRWDAKAHQLVPVGGGGVWSALVALPPGRHEYAFVIDGARWVADPAAAAAIADEFGGQSSVVTVGAPARPRSS